MALGPLGPVMIGCDLPYSQTPEVKKAIAVVGSGLLAKPGERDDAYSLFPKQDSNLSSSWVLPAAFAALATLMILSVTR